MATRRIFFHRAHNAARTRTVEGPPGARSVLDWGHSFVRAAKLCPQSRHVLLESAMCTDIGAQSWYTLNNYPTSISRDAHEEEGHRCST